MKKNGGEERTIEGEMMIEERKMNIKDVKNEGQQIQG
jgi:hypothetical protein